MRRERVIHVYASQSHKAVADCDMVPSWCVENILSAGLHSGKQRRLNLAADWPGQVVARSILEDTIIGSVAQLYRQLAWRRAWSEAPPYPARRPWNDQRVA